jgi:hypothetical protein
MISNMGPTAGRIVGSAKLTPEEHAKFWSRVATSKPTECWIWRGGNYGRYGSFQFRGKTSLAHRIAFLATGGEIKPGHCVCHKCDNTRCVNPSHLFLASQGENMWDKIRKGRANYSTGPRVRSGSAMVSRKEFA